MRFLLDTNLLSEQTRKRSDLGVTTWIAAQEPEELAISVISLGEIERGVILLRPGPHKKELRNWLDEEVQVKYKDRTISVDKAIALEWGRISADAARTGRGLPESDGLLVATAIVLNLTLVTRNERHCAGWGAPLINPWSGETRD
jgi:predicted nucleic acid-binding protein